MNPAVTKRFFSDLCEANPLAAHHLMMGILQRPVGGHPIYLPQLIETKDHTKYLREMEDVAKKYILKSREPA